MKATLTMTKWVYINKCTPSRYIYVPTCIDRAHIDRQSDRQVYIFNPIYSKFQRSNLIYDYKLINNLPEF